MGFDAVGLSSTPWEVARSFAAMLQLANSRKIEICRHTDMQPGLPRTVPGPKPSGVSYQSMTGLNQSFHWLLTMLACTGVVLAQPVS